MCKEQRVKSSVVKSFSDEAAGCDDHRSDEDFRYNILGQLEKWIKANDDSTNEQWSEKVFEFLGEVWPRQKSIKTPACSSWLCNLAFSNEKLFPEISEIIIPLLTTVDCNLLILPSHLDSEDKVTGKYPYQMLAILDKALPDDVRVWPDGVEAILKDLKAADSSIKVDERFIELQRKWNAR